MATDDPMPTGRQCEQCGAESAVDADACAHCAAPFEIHAEAADADAVAAPEVDDADATPGSRCCSSEQVAMVVAVLVGLGTGLLVLVTAAVVVGDAPKIGVFVLLGLALLAYAAMGFRLGGKATFGVGEAPAIAEYGIAAAYAHLGLAFGIATLLPSEFNNAALMGLGLLPLVLFLGAALVGDKLRSQPDEPREEISSAE